MKNKSFLNLTFNILSFLISIGLSFWITPFIVHSLGSDAYGFIPLTQQLISYMTVLTVSVTAMSGRFFTISKKQGNLQDAQNYFSTTLTAALIGSAVLGVPLVAGSVYIDKILNIPAHLIGDVRMAFLIYGAIFLLSFLTACFNVGAFSNNKLYITSGINIVNLCVRSLMIVMIFALLTPRIWFVSLSNLIAAIVVFIITIMLFKKLEPAIRIGKLSTSKLGEILKSGSWISISEIGVVLFLQVDLFIANRNIGAALAGEYSVVLQLPTILRTFSGSIISIFTPTVISLFALNQLEEMKVYLNNAVKYTGLALALPIGLVCGFGGILLSLWISPSYMKYQLLLSILTIHLSVNLSAQSIMSVQTAMNKLKLPAIVTLFMGVINFLLAYILSGPLKLGAMGIAIAGSLVLTAKNLVFSPIYAAHISGQKWYTYLKGVTIPFLATLGIAGVSYAIQSFYKIGSFPVLFLLCAAVGIIYLMAVYIFLLNKKEKKIVKDRVESVIKMRLGR